MYLSSLLWFFICSFNCYCFISCLFALHIANGSRYEHWTHVLISRKILGDESVCLLFFLYIHTLNVRIFMNIIWFFSYVCLVFNCVGFCDTGKARMCFKYDSTSSMRMRVFVHSELFYLCPLFPTFFLRYPIVRLLVRLLFFTVLHAKLCVRVCMWMFFLEIYFSLNFSKALISHSSISRLRSWLIWM